MDNKTEGRGFLSDGYTAFKWTVYPSDGDFTIFGVDGSVSLQFFTEERAVEDVGRLISALEQFVQSI